MKLRGKDDYKADAIKCSLACTTARSKVQANMKAGTSTEKDCLADEACVAFKKTCGAEAPAGWYVTTQTETVIKDVGAYKDSTQKTSSLPACYPSSCEGTDFTTYTVEKQDPIVEETKIMEGYTTTTTTTFEQMPAGFPIMIIIIVVAVLGLCVTAFLIKTGRCKCCGKCCPQGAGGAAMDGKTAGQTPPGYVQK